MKALAVGALAVAAMLGWTSSGLADPVAVRYLEGVTRGFPVLKSPKGEKLAFGDLTQIATADRVESRMTFRFKDGSFYDETVVFSQRDVFLLLSYRLVQRGPSFPETIDGSFDRKTQRYEVRYRGDEDSEEEVYRGRFELPDDAYNGMLTTLMKNLAPGSSPTVHIVAFTPKPRAIKMQLVPSGQDPVLVGESPVQATRYRIKPQLGLVASLLVTDLPDVTCWVLEGVAPAFMKFEGPLYFQGPVWLIEPN